MAWRHFTALGTTIDLVDESAESETNLSLASALINDFERRFSRFLADSELSALNSSAGKKFSASRQLADLLSLCLFYNQKTAGLFNPLILPALEAAGYDRSFVEIDPAAARPVSAPLASPDLAENLQVNGQEIILAAGCRLDLGGIGKGFLADYLADRLLAQSDNFWLSLGGDLRLKGPGPDGQGWLVDVFDPWQADRVEFILKTAGREMAVATSSILKRRGEGWHHLIDPQCGLPAETDIAAATVIASSATEADVLAKAMIMSGSQKAFDLLEKYPGASGLLFLKDGSQRPSEKFKQYIYDQDH